MNLHSKFPRCFSCFISVIFFEKLKKDHPLLVSLLLNPLIRNSDKSFPHCELLILTNDQSGVCSTWGKMSSKETRKH